MTAQWPAYAESTFVRIAIAASGSRRSQQVALEHLALRHQIAVLRRNVRRPKLRQRDRLFWITLTRTWADWKSAVVNRATRDRDRLAAEAFQAILVEIVPEKRAGTTTSACGGPNAGGKDGRGQSALGCA